MNKIIANSHNCRLSFFVGSSRRKDQTAWQNADFLQH